MKTFRGGEIKASLIWQRVIPLACDTPPLPYQIGNSFNPPVKCYVKYHTHVEMATALTERSRVGQANVKSVDST